MRKIVLLCEQKDAQRRELGHDFPQAGTLTELSYCRRCGCGVSFDFSEDDAKPCPGRPT